MGSDWLMTFILFSTIGTAIYVFAIVPLFPAPPNTTPTFTNLTFTLTSSSSTSPTRSGSFIHQPDASTPGTPTVNSSTDDKYLSNVLVFSASSLNDEEYILTMNVGVDSVLLLDYIIYTAGDNDEPLGDGSSLTSTAPDSQRTAGLISDRWATFKTISNIFGVLHLSFRALDEVLSDHS